MPEQLIHRLARQDDLPVLKPLMDAAIGELLKPYLRPDAVAASFAIVGLDTQLIDDGTYFVVLDGSAIAGCGGWSRRATLFGGDHSPGVQRGAARSRDRRRDGCGRCTRIQCSGGGASDV